MKENEFDIYVRTALQDAEEPVSPKVWEGVSAGLQKRRRVFPLWGWWSTAGAALAAAAVAGFVFLNPVSKQETHSNSTISTAPVAQKAAPVEEAVPAIQETFSSTEPQPSAVRLAVAPKAPKAHKAPEIVPEVIPAQPELPSLVQRPVAETRPVIKAGPVLRQGVEDASLLAQLAYTEASKPREKVVSATLSGHLQSTQRSNVNGGFARPYAVSAQMQPMEEGITEGPETIFGLPFSAGLGVRFNLSSRWSLGTGVRYTYLTRTFPGIYQGNGIRTNPPVTIDNNQHWLGIPLNLYFNLVAQGRWRLHAFAGGAAEYLLDNHYLVHYSPKDIHYHKKEQAPIQWSGAAGLGAEFMLSPLVGIYIDPSVRYYFCTDQQPARSLRTIHPLMFDVEMGLRFSF